MKKLNKENIEDILALTPMQEGMLFQYLKNPGSDYYFEQLCLDITGHPDMNTFEEAWNFVVETNEMLRTVFRWDKIENPIQVVLRMHRLHPAYYDFSNRDVHEREKQLREVKVKDRNDRFDLREVPFRVILCKVEENKYEMIISSHHILYDGWSNGILLREFFYAYNDLSGGRRPVKAVKTGFKEFVKWSRNPDADKDRQEKFWKDYLKGFNTQTELSVKRVREKGNEITAAGKYSFRFEAGVKDKIDRFIKKYKITLASFLYSAWGLLLTRYNNSDDVIFGTTVSGRTAKIDGIEDIVGLFINTLPLRMQGDFNPDEKVGDLLCRIDSSLQMREEYEHTSLAGIKKYCDIDNREEFFDSIVVIENYPLDSRLIPENSKLSADSYSIIENTHYDLTVGVTTEPDTAVTFGYKKGMFDEDAIVGLSHHFMSIAEKIAAHPDLLVSELEIITNEEKNRILHDFNKTDAGYPRDKTIHELFEEQVMRTPENIALHGCMNAWMHEGVHIAYRELNKRADQAAYVLKERGVLPDSIVGIMMGRSVEMIIGILGILKAGGAYLPIEPDYPRERIDYMLKDSGAELLVTTDNIFSSAFSAVNIFLPATGHRPPATSLAYVIYTSGSTGRPKGVLVEHNSVVNLAISQKRIFNITGDDRILQFSSLCFDASVEQIFIALFSGAMLVLIDKDMLLDSGRFEEFTARHGITHIHAVPSFLNNMRLSESYQVRRIIAGGDICPVSLARKWSKYCDFYNEYGPTETTVTSLLMRIKDGEGGAWESPIVPIGKPISNTVVYLFDRWMKLVPQGVPGELYIGGDGVSRGYLNRPELTNEKFCGGPGGGFSKEPPGRRRLYKTGDLGRWLPGGDVEFLGRMDQQVKIRGFRVELGEIESRLSGYEGIKEAVVALKEHNKPGDKYLVAYFVPAPGKAAATDVSKLREHLSQTLPEYMIPAYFLPLDEIPLTSTGKVNRKALPDPGIKHEKRIAAPRNKKEKALVDIWADVLGIEPGQIGIDDNFFDLGGHSLKVMGLIGRIQKIFDAAIPAAGVFKRPTIRGLSKYLESEAVESRIYRAVECAEKQEYYPLSSAQKRLYVLWQMDKQRIVYNMAEAMILEGDFDSDRFEGVSRKLIVRHESLRTSFHMIGDEPVQKVHDEVEFAIEYLAAKNAKDREGIISNFIKPFDLSKAPLLRVGLIKESHEIHILIVDMHHIISDGISVEILIKEFTAFYRGEKLLPLRLQYKDYSEWQRRSEVREVLKKQKEYWSAEFSGEVPVLELPLDFVRPKVQRFEGRRVRFEITEQETQQLKALTSEGGATLYMILLAVYTVFLAKITGQEDIIVGTPAAGRRHPDLEPVIGIFINTLALAGQPCGEKTFTAFLEEVDRNALEAFDNQDYPFEELVEALAAGGNIDRDPAHHPLFNTMFALQTIDVSRLQIPGLKLNPYAHETHTAKFDLLLQAVELEENRSLGFTLEYSTHLFEETAIYRFIEYFKRVTAAVADRPEIKIAEIEIISEAEKKQVLAAFNDSKTGYPDDKTLHELFAEQAGQAPGGTALVGSGQLTVGKKEKMHITYRQLNEKSNRLAHLLQEKGIVPDTIVGLMMERSIEMIIGILGILKAGGAYLPIDPNYPRERIDYMLTDSGAKLLVTANNLEEVPNFLTSQLPNFHLSPATSLAYVIYTSGSTGKPKGTLTSHRNAVRVVKHTNYIVLTSEDRILQLSNYAFDGSVFDIYGALLNGAVLVLIKPGDASSPGNLSEVIEKEKITAFFVTTALFNALIDVAADCFRKVRKVLFGGEKISVDHSRKALGSLGKDKLIHVYGPTETTVYAAYYPLNSIDERALTIPIGGPTSNTSVYILDKYLNPVPVMIYGEVHIGGDGVARGYLNNPGLTAEKFVFVCYRSYIPSKKIYKTGDLARWLPCGNIEFLGRIDQQVKIRGFRIEPREIERSLLKHESIGDAVVLVKKRENNEKYLCAYIVSDRELSSLELKGFLSGSLPDYMVPAYFVLLEKIPLTANGKVDWRVLPDPAAERGRVYAPPTNEIEARLMEIWVEILKLQTPVGIDDNFFEMGGHSIKATLLLSRIHKTFDADLSLTDIFTAPTVRELAALVKEAAGDKYISILPVETKDYYRLSSAQKRIYVLQQMDDRGIGYNIPSVWMLEGTLDKEKLAEVFRRLIEMHESFRTSFVEVDEVPMQRVHDNVEFEIEYYLATEGTENTEKKKEIQNSFIRSFDLAAAPLLRVGLIKLENRKHILMVDMHHIISDGTSAEVLAREFAACYEGKELPTLRLQYKDYSEWQPRKGSGEFLLKQQAHWLKEFEGEIPLLNLPADYPRPAIQSFEGRIRTFTLGGAFTDALRKISVEQGATLFMVLLAVTDIFLSRISGQEDIILGTPIAGRRHGDLEPIIGMFVNTLALRNFPGGNKTFRDFLAELKKRTLLAYENQDYQYEDLVEKVNVNRDASRNPLFDIAFSLQNADIGRWQLTDLKLENLPFDIGISKFDLTFFSIESKEDVSFQLQYCTRLFKESTIDRFIDYYKNVVSAISADHEKKIAGIEILSEKEKKQLVYVFNDTAAEYSRDKTLHGLFEEQVEKTPGNTAVVGREKTSGEFVHLTYRELNTRANRLAWALREKGMDPDSFAVVLTDRSIEMVTGVMGILKAGGAYVPVESYLPESRASYIMTSLNIRRVLTDSRQKQRFGDVLAKLPGLTAVISLEEGTGGIEKKPGTNPPPRAASRDIAYVIHTSGSTGTPKGVVVKHRPAINIIEWVNKTFAVGAWDRELFVTSLGFDLSVYDIFGILASGASLRVVAAEDIKNPTRLLNIIFREGITFWDSAPAALQQLTAFFPEARRNKNKSCLRLVFLSGDWVPLAMPEDLKKTFKGVTINVMGGATEATIWSNYFRVEEIAPHWVSIPYGKPIRNAAYYVLDRYGNVCPFGVSGDLYIGGECLASGYINDLDLTAAKFVDNPFIPGTLMYKTGDLARWLQDGNMEFLGRNDSQVKIRGYRIELGEIESQLLNYNAVKEAVILAVGAGGAAGASGAKTRDMRLAAYVVPDPEYAYPVSQLLRSEREGMLAHRQRYDLPNGMTLFYLNRSETDFMYHEIFEEQAYLKHGITLEDGACVFDVGANIGLFSLFVHRVCKNAGIYAFEPIPSIYELLQLNTSIYGGNIKIYECGLGGEEKEVEFTYYPHVSILSGRFAKIEEEQEAVRAYIFSHEPRDTGDGADGGLAEFQVNELLRDRLSSITCTRPLKTLSGIIREKGIEKIDLLKINVEKSEKDVLSGIAEQDWPRIRQLAVEVHDVGGRLDEVVQLLKRHRYDVAVEQEEVMGNTAFYHVFAISRDIKKEKTGNKRKPIESHGANYLNANRLIANMKCFLKEKLPEYMIPQAFVLLDRLPLTPNGKVDRKALPEPVMESGAGYSAPGDEIETRLTEIWAEVLGSQALIGIDDNFFESGGHSLSATTLVARIHKVFDVKIPLAEVFRIPDIRGQAAYIRSTAKETFISINTIEEMEYYRLSSAQKRLYLLYRMDPENIGYNMPAAVTLEGKIEKQELEYIFQQLIARHESLRTTFHMVENEPVQKVHQDVEFEIENFLATEDTEVFIRPFDLSHVPLLRVGLIEESREKHLLLVDMHHIISDGMSVSLLLKEFISLAGGEKLPEPGVTYKDYAWWQQEQLETQAVKKQEIYWLGEFSGEVPVLNLPLDFPRPRVRDYKGDALVFEIGSEEMGRLKKIMLEEDVTLFMVLLSLVNILLFRLSSQEDIVVGSPVAGRLLAGLEHVIGMFINTLALRNYPSGEKTCRQFLQEVKERALSAFENQEYQFEELVERLPINRDMGRNPLFDAALDVQNIDMPPLDIETAGLKLKSCPLHSGISKFDLVFHCEEIKGRLQITVDYAVKLFKEKTVRRFINYFRKILTHVIDNRDIAVGEIDILSEKEKQEIVKDLNGNISYYPETSLHRLFEEQVERSPGGTALVGKGHDGLAVDKKEKIHITYRQLNEKSNQLAHLLRKKGVEPDTIVGIMTGPFLERIIAILAVLKAGGAYLPIDHTYPTERIRFMLDDGTVKLLLTEHSVLEGHSFTTLQGIDWDSHGGIIITAPRPQLTDLDNQPLVDRTTVNYDKYNRYIGLAMVKQAITIQGTRGCPYHCAYCHKIWPKKHVYRSAENIFKEVQLYYNLGVRRFVFIDDIFNLNIENSRRFFRLIIDHGLKVQFFFPNGVRGDILTRDYIDLMVRAGTVNMALALETASPRLQKLMGKNLNVEKLRENLEYICERYPHVILELFTMHGFPTETEEEALMTLDFIKSLKWLHFPYFHILKIYPSTDMAALARKHGIPDKTIAQSANLAYHELPATLPFEKRFTLKCQADFLNRYFLSKERLLQVLPHQVKFLTEDELVQKYNSYLPVEIKTFHDFLEFAGIREDELGMSDFSHEWPRHVPDLNRRIKEVFPAQRPEENALRILLLDLSQFFSKEKGNILYDVVEPPLGLMYLLTALKQEFGGKVRGKIAKSRIDFDNYEELKQLLEEFKPDIIGFRTLTYYRDFFHQTAAVIRQWGIDAPVIAGGPYATSDYASLLKDRNIDLVVLGEGERTLCEIAARVLENDGKLPDSTVLKQIQGIAYVPRRDRYAAAAFSRDIIMTDALYEEPAKEPVENLSHTGRRQPVDTAYVIYTSGTTGKPKGVLVEHRNIAGLMAAGKDLFDYHNRDVWTMYHSYCFDFSVWEMYGALLFGGKLVLIPRMLARDPQRYLEILRKEKVTILNQTPTVFYQLVEEETRTPLKELRLRYVIFGGEALKPGKLKPWREKYPETRLINMYGITETTVHVTFKEIGQNEIDLNISNIGKPIATLSGYVMNSHAKMQPGGVPGELVVGGQGVARGYVNRPGLTAERFLSVCYRSYRTYKTYISKKIYKSGDLVRILDNGEMEYLGRIDHQVKIRGNRVETGEIERQMMGLEGVEEALIIARGDEAGNNYLCAYMKVDVNGGKGINISDLREKLLKKMPDYMVPSYFIPLEKFPVTAAGKVDRRKLPLPEGFRPTLGAAFAAPETETQRTIAAIWKEILKVDRVGIHDNFFDLGGTSLDIVRLNGRLKEVLEKDIPIVTLFEYPTVHTFTRQVVREEMSEAVPVEVDREGRDMEDIGDRFRKGRDKMKGRKQRLG